MPETLSRAEKGWSGRLKLGLGRTSASFAQGMAAIFTRRKLDNRTLDELEDFLLEADVGVEVAEDIRRDLSHLYLDCEISAESVRETVADWIAKTLSPVAVPLSVDPAHKPNVILIIGVNGTGKTTTIGKLAWQLRNVGKSVTIAAADTFRAAAIDQLRTWGERANCPVITASAGIDPASVAFDAFTQSQSERHDVLFIDTAGRLHNKQNLMEELEKIERVLKKIDSSAPHACLLVLDATTGQNALTQVETFARIVRVTGLVVTKLDGTAHGGVLVAIAKKFHLPIHAIGVGEEINDLRPFSGEDVARAIVGLASHTS